MNTFPEDGAAQHATIRITNLRLRTFIGFNPDERVKPQDIVIQVAIRHRIDAAAFHDRVDAALNYKTITKAIIQHVEQGRFLLLERLVHDVLTICRADARVEHACVTIDKPHALRFADSVSVTLEYDKPSSLPVTEIHHDHARRPTCYAS